jgi:transposase
LDLDAFDEDDLYANLDWLCGKQAVIERRLFQKLHAGHESSFFLYDVTSSYLEGTENELAAWGYNRDGKKGKKQIVIGLLCDEQGEAVSVEVFQGNTQDPRTFGPQIKKVVERFGLRAITFVGDRGMIKSHQIDALGERGFHYITAITKPQIEALLKQETIQLELFDQELADVSTSAGVRYVLRRNPARAQELQASRQDKLAVLEQAVENRNAYLQAHPRASVAVARRRLEKRAEQLLVARWVTSSSDEANRRIALSVDEAVLAETAKLDGCYVLKTDLSPELAGAETVHDRYKDLALVESAFRTSKTVELELRPIHVRLASRTRGHVFVVMLAYRLVRELAKRWRALDCTVQEGLHELSSLCATEILDQGQAVCCQIPEPRPSVKRLLEAAHVQLPEALPCKGINVTTKRKLPTRRTKS